MDKNANLFPGSGDRMGFEDELADFSGSNIRALKQPDGSFLLETSTINFSDARVFGHGALTPVTNRVGEKSPNFRGHLNEPDEGTGVKPERYRVSAWTRQIKSGENVGKTYLSLALTLE